MSTKEESERFIILSDGTGDTAENFVRAILAQFNLEGVKPKRFTKISTEKKLIAALDQIKGNSLICYTFASESLRKIAWGLLREREHVGLDLLYPAVEVFSNFLNTDPTQRIGVLHSTQSVDYYQRIDAIEFTVKHDDGMRMNDLTEADFVLVGVSRSSKTPTCIYLAHRGYRVANVPMILGVEPPKELIAAHQSGKPVVCLTINEIDLERIRRVRFQSLGARTNRHDSYIDLERIRDELKATQQLARRYNWPIINVTDKAIEETAAEILLLVNAKAS